MALFEGVTTRLQLIATFLGLLELLRRGLVRARQTDPGSEITIYRTVETAVETDGHSG
jgi:chromatin segregation and condensation protein Rec8/ScpA/Scc1 (kleisin family)